MSDAPAVTASAKFKSALDLFTDRVTEWIPKNLNIWLIALTCLIVLVALSRLLSLQKSVSELQSRPSVDEHLVRQVVRQHLEETVRAMDQQNRVQLQMRQQQMMEQARKAQQVMLEKQNQLAAIPVAKIEIVENGPLPPFDPVVATDIPRVVPHEEQPSPAEQPAPAQEPQPSPVQASQPAPAQASQPEVSQPASVLDAVTGVVDSEAEPSVPAVAKAAASPAARTKRHKTKPIAV